MRCLLTTARPAQRGPGCATDAALDLDQPFESDPLVEIRPEPFGALLYHFGTRRLSFVKDRALAEVLLMLPEAESLRAACVFAGLDGTDIPASYLNALRTLAATGMIRARAA